MVVAFNIYMCASLLVFGVHSARTSQKALQEALTEADSMVAEPCNVVVENLTPYKLDKVMVIHKMNDVDPHTHALVSESIEPSGEGKLNTVMTSTQSRKGDWWLVTYTFAPVPSTNNDSLPESLQGPEYECPLCKKSPAECMKDDGTCQTWITSPKNYWTQVFTSQATYINAAAFTAGVVASVLSAGILAPLAVGLAGLVTNVVSTQMLSGTDTIGFGRLKLKAKDVANSNAGKSVRIIIFQDKVRIQTFTAETLDPATYRPSGRLLDMVVADLPTAAAWDGKGTHIPVDVRHTYSGSSPETQKISKLAIIHKHNGVKPKNQLLEWTDVLPTGRPTGIPQNVLTSVGQFNILSDWWIVAWQDETDKCLVKSTVEPRSWVQIQSTPLAANFLDAIQFVQPFMKLASNTVLTLASIGYPELAATNGAGGSKITLDLFGTDLLKLLSRGRSTEDYFKCSLRLGDIDNADAGNSVVIDIREDYGRMPVVDFHFKDKVCTAPVQVLGCLNTEECNAEERCKSFEPKDLDVSVVKADELEGFDATYNDKLDIFDYTRTMRAEKPELYSRLEEQKKDQKMRNLMDMVTGHGEMDMDY